MDSHSWESQYAFQIHLQAMLADMNQTISESQKLIRESRATLAAGRTCADRATTTLEHRAPFPES